MDTQIVQPPSYLGTWEFQYHDKPRLAVVLGTRDTGGFQTLTPDGFRTFLPEKMVGIRDVTTLTTLGI